MRPLVYFVQLHQLARLEVETRFFFFKGGSQRGGEGLVERKMNEIN